MIDSILITPKAVDIEQLYRSIDQMGKYILSLDSLSPLHLSENNYLQEICENLNFDTDCVGNTDTIFYDTECTFKMMYYSSKNQNVNLLGSILHSEGIKLYGNVVIIKMNNDETFAECTIKDIILLLVKRREHSGIKECNENLSLVTMDNLWNIDGVSKKHLQKQIIKMYNYDLLVMCENDTKFVFAFLNDKRKVIGDLSEIEYKMLLKLKDKIPKLDEDDANDNPYNHLKLAFDRII